MLNPCGLTTIGPTARSHGLFTISTTVRPRFYCNSVVFSAIILQQFHQMVLVPRITKSV